MQWKPKTVGELKEFIKDLSDDMPVYIDDGGDEYMLCLSIVTRDIQVYDDREYVEEGEYWDVESLVISVT